MWGHTRYVVRRPYISGLMHLQYLLTSSSTLANANLWRINIPNGVSEWQYRTPSDITSHKWKPAAAEYGGMGILLGHWLSVIQLPRRLAKLSGRT